MEIQNPTTDWKELFANAAGNLLTGYGEGLATQRQRDSRGTAGQLEYADARAESFVGDGQSVGGMNVKTLLIIGVVAVVGIVVLKKVL